MHSGRKAYSGIEGKRQVASPRSVRVFRLVRIGANGERVEIHRKSMNAFLLSAGTAYRPIESKSDAPDGSISIRDP